MKGWIKDHRKELLSDIWMLPPLYHRVWQYLKYKANHKEKTIPTKTGPLTVKKGQTITSMRQIAEAVKWTEYGVERIPSPKTIREILNVLQNMEMVTRESNAKGTVITILNYCIYQGDDNGESNAEETQRKRTGPTNKNEENEENEKKETICAEVIDYLNNIAGKNFSPKTKETQKLINGRLSDGYTLEDFKTVISKKYNGWKGKKNKDGTPMENFLRPQTLFLPSNFESYLNEKAETDRKVVDF